MHHREGGTTSSRKDEGDITTANASGITRKVRGDERHAQMHHPEMQAPPRDLSAIEGKTTDQSCATNEAPAWESHTFTIDSGACDHAFSDSSMDIPTVPGDKSRRGVSYEVANGDEVHNLGEKICIFATEFNEDALPLTMQV